MGRLRFLEEILVALKLVGAPLPAYGTSFILQFKKLAYASSLT